MYNKYEIIYNDNGNVIVIDEFSGNMSLTVNQALQLCNVAMDEYADNQGWDGYDWNCLEIRFKED